MKRCDLRLSTTFLMVRLCLCLVLPLVTACADIMGFQDGRPFPPDPGSGAADSGTEAGAQSEGSVEPGNGKEGGSDASESGNGGGNDASESGNGSDGGNDGPMDCTLGIQQPCSRALGNCAKGHQTCGSDGTFGMCDVAPKGADACDTPGDDANCNGTANDGCPCVDGDTQSCGPDNPQGICKKGIAICRNQRWGPCDAIFPNARDCTSSADNDCDGKPDNIGDAVCQCTVAAARPCQTHPGLDGQGACRAGSQTCLLQPDKSASSWGECGGSVGPSARDCTSSNDNDCDGKVDNTIDSICQCNTPDAMQPCDTHPQDGFGICRAGYRTCSVGANKTTASWTACSGSVAPGPRNCASPADNDCDGKADNAVDQGAMTFDYTGQEATFQVPPCVTRIEVDASGAQGGDYSVGTFFAGGAGGRVQATLVVTPGQVLRIFVGGAGGHCGSVWDFETITPLAGGFNGGGGVDCGLGVGAGGGASDIRTGPLLSDRILVAGGGGGASDGSPPGPFVCPSGAGGLGGGITGGDAPTCNSASGGLADGGGGTQTMGGLGGAQADIRAESGSFGFGGHGLTDSGAGGGGWWGGGAGRDQGGGGGGSSYVDAALGFNVAHMQGYRNGNGQVTIRW